MYQLPFARRTFAWACSCLDRVLPRFVARKGAIAVAFIVAIAVAFVVAVTVAFVVAIAVARYIALRLRQ